MKMNLSLPAAACRWTARILGTLLVMAVACLAIGGGMPNPFTQPAKVQIGFLALGMLLSGMLAGWRWELAGGIISLAGWGIFMAAVVGAPRHGTWFISLLALPGVLYVVSRLLRRNNAKMERPK
jgi:hypothetical protein